MRVTARDAKERILMRLAKMQMETLKADDKQLEDMMDKMFEESLYNFVIVPNYDDSDECSFNRDGWII
jgi:hypothetical protein